jgi:hypothetical protein
VLLDSQATFHRLARQTNSHVNHLTEDGRPIIAPDFYLTNYAQLTTNGVQKLPDAQDWDDPVALMQHLGLVTGEEHKNADPESKWSDRPDFSSACEFFAWRDVRWFSEYRLLNVDVDDTATELKEALDRELILLSTNDSDWAARQRDRLHEAHAILQHLVCRGRVPRKDLSPLSKLFYTPLRRAAGAMECTQERDYAKEDGGGGVLRRRRTKRPTPLHAAPPGE